MRETLPPLKYGVGDWGVGGNWSEEVGRREEGWDGGKEQGWDGGKEQGRDGGKEQGRDGGKEQGRGALVTSLAGRVATK